MGPNGLSHRLSAVPESTRNGPEPGPFRPLLSFYINYLDCVAVEPVCCELLSAMLSLRIPHLQRKIQNLQGNLAAP